MAVILTAVRNYFNWCPEMKSYTDALCSKLEEHKMNVVYVSNISHHVESYCPALNDKCYI
jgi:hypothetical protein